LSRRTSKAVKLTMHTIQRLLFAGICACFSLFIHAQDDRTNISLGVAIAKPLKFNAGPGLFMNFEHFLYDRLSANLQVQAFKFKGNMVDLIGEDISGNNNHILVPYRLNIQTMNMAVKARYYQHEFDWLESNFYAEGGILFQMSSYDPQTGAYDPTNYTVHVPKHAGFVYNLALSVGGGYQYAFDRITLCTYFNYNHHFASLHVYSGESNFNTSFLSLGVGIKFIPGYYFGMGLGGVGTLGNRF